MLKTTGMMGQQKLKSTVYDYLWQMVVTYEEIREYVKEQHGFHAKNCWIADVKEDYGLTSGPASNRQKPRANPCPSHRREAIEDALKRFDII
ncbi:hypothetical protein [Natrinema ejinorense]|uniref:hypothetical protein n=1 Tax=Natrinema ejinorense TaxID=373386 RepID=UPI00117D0B97|nr:hypothetical protein [Natrinema ejinorense]